MQKALIFLILIFYPIFSIAATDPQKSPEIQQAVNQWTVALSSGDPEKIAALYDDNAFLYATFRDKISDHQKIADYFKMLMANKDLKVQFTAQNIRVYYGAAVNSGLYVFSYLHDGKVVEVPARFTFVYALEPTGWKIIDHHSSVLPENK